MSKFTNHFAYFEVQPRGTFELSAPLMWEVGKLGSGLVVTVPKGFRFEVSVPDRLRWLINPRDRRYLLAAAVHDHLVAEKWSNNRSAIEFYHGLKAMGVGRVERFILTACVLAWTTL